MLLAALPAAVGFDIRSSGAGGGGAVFALGGSLSVSGATLADNAAPFGIGGAVFVECGANGAGQAAVAINATRFLRNTVRWGSFGFHSSTSQGTVGTRRDTSCVF